MAQSIDQFVQPVLAAIAAIGISTAAVVGFAWWIFKTFSSKWLDRKFAQEIEVLRKDHQKELEHLRLEINALLDRTIKLHAKEFEVLPTAWQLLDEAFAATERLSISYFTIPDLDNKSAADVELILADTSFSEINKSHVRSATKKNDAYLDVLRAQAFGVAQTARVKFYNYFMANGIFLQPHFKDHFLAIHEMIVAACIERQFEVQHPGIKAELKHAKSIKLHEVGTKKMEELQEAIRERLWSSAKAAISEPAKI